MKLLQILQLLFFFITCIFAQNELDWWETAAFYQIYPRSFSDSDGDGIGDLNGITSKLEYLKDIGIDAFWLSPIFKSPMFDFGYDISDFRDIDPVFGNLTDFDKLEAVLAMCEHYADVQTVMRVYGEKNDTRKGPMMPFNFLILQEFKNGSTAGDLKATIDKWMTNKPKQYAPNWVMGNHDGTRVATRFGSNMINFMNVLILSLPGASVTYYSEAFKNGVFEYDVSENVLLILRGTEKERYLILLNLNNEQVIVDASKVFKIPQTLSYALTQSDNRSKGFYDSDNDGVGDLNGIKIKTKYLSELGVDGVWLSPIMKSPMVDFGYDISDFRDIDQTFGSMKDFDELLAEFKRHGLYMILDFVPNHQEETYRMIYDWRTVLDEYKSFPRIMMTEAYTSLSNIMRYYGDGFGTLGSQIPFNFELLTKINKNSTGADIKAIVSRDPARTPFQWNSNKNAGFSSADKTWLPMAKNYETVNVEIESRTDRSHLGIYKKLVQLKKNKVFRWGDYKSALIQGEVYAFTRNYQNETFIIVLNFGKNDLTINLKKSFPSLKSNLRIVTTSLSSTLKENAKVDSSSVKMKAESSFVAYSSCISVHAAMSFMFMSFFILISVLSFYYP
uniref:CSON008231 protein n=1 Tax=Culicoides sonorensis TaxID=179676 RepID=A0A336LEK4_CULSO